MIAAIRLGKIPGQLDMEERLLSLAQILLQKLEVPYQEEDDQSLHPEWQQCLVTCTLASFKLLQASLQPNYYKMAFQNRANIALKLTNNKINSPDTIKVAMGSTNSSQVNSTLEGGVWGAICRRFGRSVCEKCYVPSEKEIYAPLYSWIPEGKSTTWLNPLNSDRYFYPFCGWQALVAELLRTGADPNLYSPTGTPLLNVVAGAFNPDKLDPWRYFTCEPKLGEVTKKPNRGIFAVQAWLSTLETWESISKPMVRGKSQFYPKTIIGRKSGC